MTVTYLCEACKSHDIQVVATEDNPDQPYKLCRQCHARLLSYSLRPIEWYNLAVIHSPNTFLLHDDFYDDDGEATQPEDDVDVTEKDQAPELHDVQHDMEALIGFAITRWFLEADIIEALKKHDPQLLVQSIKSRFYGTKNRDVKSRMLEIAADVSGAYAADWVRELWVEYSEELLYPLAWATAGSLPHEEGLGLIFEKLNPLNEKELPTAAFTSLHRFRSVTIMDWMENICKTHNDNWGRLAAVCFPSWDRMKSWMDKGRPFSLIALDTMTNCVKGHGDYAVEQFSPQILSADVNEVEKVLHDYLQKDSVPRVRKKIAFILDNKQEIFD